MPPPRAVLSLLSTALLAPVLAFAPPRGDPEPLPPRPPDLGVRDDARSPGEATAFTHPGVLVSRDQLDRVRSKVRAGAEPWASAFQAMRKSRYAADDHTAHPVAVVACKPYAKPAACTDEREDAIAAYTHALLWALTGDRSHAEHAMRLMDAWSAVLRDHTEGNAALQAAWAGSTWARAAELVRHSYDGWPAPRVERFESMLRHAYLGEFDAEVADYNGNWDLTMTDATLAIAVFLDDRKAFDRAVARFRARVPAYFYLRSDGPLPVPPPGGTVDTPQEIRDYWFGQRTFVDGLGQETCRNFEHVGYALAATAHIAETAHHQGIDLYGEVRQRLRAAVELHARHQLGEPMPDRLCGGKPELTMGPDLEVVVNHLQNRLGMAVPHARRLADRTRPAGTDDLFVAWETLTHARNPGA